MFDHKVSFYACAAFKIVRVDEKQCGFTFKLLFIIVLQLWYMHVCVCVFFFQCCAGSSGGKARVELCKCIVHLHRISLAFVILAFDALLECIFIFSLVSHSLPFQNRLDGVWRSDKHISLSLSLLHIPLTTIAHI